MLTYLPHLIAIQTETRTLFEGGAYTSTFVTSSIEWANVQPMSTNETYEQDKKQQLTKFRVIMRYNSNISNNKKFLFNNNLYTIESVNDPSNRKKMIELICRCEVR